MYNLQFEQHTTQIIDNNQWTIYLDFNPSPKIMINERSTPNNSQQLPALLTSQFVSNKIRNPSLSNNKLSLIKIIVKVYKENE